VQPARKALPDDSREKLRRRKYRSRLYNFARLAGPIKALGFTLLIISLCYLAVTQLRHLFFATSYFELKSIELTGNNTVEREEIMKAAGIAPGLNVFSLDREAVRRRIIADPRIREVKVDLYGLYNLRLVVDERVPMLYAKVGTTFYEIADDGVIITTDGLGEKELPVITGMHLQTNRAGDSLNGSDEFFAARNWIKILGEKILADISEINFSNLQNPYLMLISGEKVFPRSLEDFKNRYDFLRALLDNLQKNNVEPIYLDMRAPSEIVVRPRKKTGASEGNRGSVKGG
jgi:cell division protein FtsQ